MSEVDIRAAAAPKSDQLNADDVIGGSMTVTVTSVKAGDKEQPIIIHYEGDSGRPYKPCKSMIRALMAAWGDKGAEWVGKSMTLFNDPTVTWAGVQVGGIRISHVSNIKSSIAMSLTTSKGKRKPYRVDPLVIAEKPAYPEDQFNEKLPAMLVAIESGKMTVEQVVQRCEQTGTLTEDQKARLVVTHAPTEDSEVF